jgi:hypothetical protein
MATGVLGTANTSVLILFSAAQFKAVRASVVCPVNTCHVEWELSRGVSPHLIMRKQ